MRQAPIADMGLNPARADSDGDLLVDGFEWYYGKDAKAQVSLHYRVTIPNGKSLPSI